MQYTTVYTEGKTNCTTHSLSYLPGQFFRQKEIVSNVLDNRALHVLHNFKYSLHIIKLSSVIKKKHTTGHSKSMVNAHDFF